MSRRCFNQPSLADAFVKAYSRSGGFLDEIAKTFDWSAISPNWPAFPPPRPRIGRLQIGAQPSWVAVSANCFALSFNQLALFVRSSSSCALSSAEFSSGLAANFPIRPIHS